MRRCVCDRVVWSVWEGASPVLGPVSARANARTHARTHARAHTHILIIDHAHIWPGLYLDQQGLYLEPRQKGIDRIFFSRWARVFQMMVFRYIRYIMLSVDARVLYTMACFW